MSKKIRVKPGKAQSQFAMIFGIAFVCIGLFVVIPTFGLFGILWTSAAAFIVYANYRNGFTDRPMSTHEIIVEDESETESIEERLKTLESLYNQRLITKEEYEEKRKIILSEL